MKHAPIQMFKVFMADTVGDKVKDVLYSGFIGQGKVVDEFENDLKMYFGTNYVVTTNSATSAEHLALQVLRDAPEGWQVPVRDGDEVLVPSLTCLATHTPHVLNKSKLVFVDVDPKTLNMDLDDLERKITERTRIIQLVHWGGYPHDMDRVEGIRRKCYERYGVAPVIIEDCAHAIGSKYKDRPVGVSHTGYGTFSLQAIKHVTSVDGGFLICPTVASNKRARLLRWYGLDRDNGLAAMRCGIDAPVIGSKWHMNDVNATIGIENFKHVDWIVGRHQENATYYDNNLFDVPGITLLERREGFDSAFWIYSMLVEDRDSFTAMMAEKGIAVSQVHDRTDKHTALKEFKSFLPTLDSIIDKVVSIPVHWGVSREDREYIVDCIQQGW